MPFFVPPVVQVSEDQCEVSDAENHVRVLFTPTIPHCGMAPIIGLSIRLKLLHTLPRRYVLLMVLHLNSWEDSRNKFF